MKPEILYHVSPACAHDAIKAEGLKANFGEVYASEAPAHALSFMWFRILDHPHLEGKNFELVPHDRIDIWTIDTSLLDLNKLEESSDHASSFFGESTTSWAYRGDIPIEALVEYNYVTREELLELTNAE